MDVGLSPLLVVVLCGSRSGAISVRTGFLRVKRTLLSPSVLCMSIPNFALLFVLLRATQACPRVQVLRQTTASILVRHLILGTAGREGGQIGPPNHERAGPILLRVGRFLARTR